MPIRPRLPSLTLGAVDELIAVRKWLHGGSRGAPPMSDGERVGAALNKSCILMLSALLQGYTEEVFLFAARRALKNLNSDNALQEFRNSFRRWGNPSPNNIQRLFARLGLIDVFDGLSWQKTSAQSIKKKLDEINRLRNMIAHGQKLPRRVSLAQVKNLRSFAEQFGSRFGGHVWRKVQ